MAPCSRLREAFLPLAHAFLTCDASTGFSERAQRGDTCPFMLSFLMRRCNSFDLTAHHPVSNAGHNTTGCRSAPCAARPHRPPSQPTHPRCPTSAACSHGGRQKINASTPQAASASRTDATTHVPSRTSTQQQVQYAHSQPASQPATPASKAKPRARQRPRQSVRAAAPARFTRLGTTSGVSLTIQPTRALPAPLPSRHGTVRSRRHAGATTHPGTQAAKARQARRRHRPQGKATSAESRRLGAARASCVLSAQLVHVHGVLDRHAAQRAL